MAVLRGWWSRGILQDSRSVGLASSGAVRAVLRSIVGRPAIYLEAAFSCVVPQ